MAMNIKSILNDGLEYGIVSIVLNPSTHGVEVPNYLKSNPQLCLNLSHRFGTSVIVTESYIEQKLLFQGSWSLCRIPFDAINEIRDTQGNEYLRASFDSQVYNSAHLLAFRPRPFAPLPIPAVSVMTESPMSSAASAGPKPGDTGTAPKDNIVSLTDWKLARKAK
jgi:hypothetical protein